jgi:hypothetical protein
LVAGTGLEFLMDRHAYLVLDAPARLDSPGEPQTVLYADDIVPVFIWSCVAR